jgi:hypothetical protein
MNRTVRIFLLVTIAGLLPLSVVNRAQETASGWRPFENLLGDWVGEGGGQPGQGGGEFSFQLDLQKRVLVRKSYAAYPAANGRPAFRHDDLIVVYRESENSPVKALYLDSEGHVIHYSVRVSGDQKTIEFVSDVLPSTPTYRLTYLMTGGNTLNIKFEIAPPGKPGAFSTYIEAKAKRK